MTQNNTKIKSGDRKPHLAAQLGGGPTDWTGAAAEIAIKAKGVPGAPTRHAVTFDAALKQVEWDYTGFDTSVAGIYEYEWIITFSDDDEMTAPNEGYDLLTICKSL